MQHENLGPLHLAAESSLQDKGLLERSFRSTDGSEVKEVSLVGANNNDIRGLGRRRAAAAVAQESKSIIDEPPAMNSNDDNSNTDNQQPLVEQKLDEPEANNGDDETATLQVVQNGLKEIVDNEENVLEENRRSDNAKDFKVGGRSFSLWRL